MRRLSYLTVLMVLAGCGGGENAPGPAGSPDAKLPVFTLATSEYPSWSVFMVADKAGLINGKEGGEYGPLEKKHGVDVVVLAQDYDPCITSFNNGSVDASCLTNADSLKSSLSRPLTVVMPTSTSEGGDKVIGVGYAGSDPTKYLSEHPTFGLDNSVSRYVWHRGLEKLNVDPSQYKFTNLDPAAAATALQQQTSKDIQAICVWNPFALQTLRQNPDAKVVFTSSVIPEEIIDMVVIGNDSLKKPGGDKFASCVCDIYYNVTKRLNDPDQRVSDATYKALGEDFSNLSVEDMRLVCKDTRFYDTPEKGIALFENAKFHDTMKTVVETCRKVGMLEANQNPDVGFNDPSKSYNFETKFMKSVTK